MSTTSNLIGSVSSGTMREEDLIPAFLDALETVNRKRADAIRDEHQDILAKVGDDKLSNDDLESQSWLCWEVLCEALNNEALPYFYFGSHPGDGADYGFWLPEGFEQDFEDNGGLRVSDTSEVPDDYTGEVLHFNDHGNCTLYSAQDGKLTEVWAVV